MSRYSVSVLVAALALLAAPTVCLAAAPAQQGNLLGVLGQPTAISLALGAQTHSVKESKVATTLPDPSPAAGLCYRILNCQDGQTLTCVSESGYCSSVGISPPSQCGYISCDGNIQRCTTYHRSTRVFGSCCSVSGGLSQQWASQTSCDDSTWYTTGYFCSGGCIG